MDFADHGEVGGVLPRDGGAASDTLSAIGKAGVDLVALAADFQAEGAKSFDESWSDLLEDDRHEVARAGRTSRRQCDERYGQRSPTRQNGRRFRRITRA